MDIDLQHTMHIGVLSNIDKNKTVYRSIKNHSFCFLLLINCLFQSYFLLFECIFIIFFYFKFLYRIMP